MHLTLRITWTTQRDPQVCPICKALEGYTWILEVGDPLPKQLIHPIYGPVYDTRPAVKGSLITEEKGHLCRCTLQNGVDLSGSDTNDDNGPANTSNKHPGENLVKQE